MAEDAHFEEPISLIKVPKTSVRETSVWLPCARPPNAIASQTFAASFRLSAWSSRPRIQALVLTIAYRRFRGQIGDNVPHARAPLVQFNRNVNRFNSHHQEELAA